MGTTRKGQLLLGVIGLIVGAGGGIGLEAKPDTFEPILEGAMYALRVLLKTQLYYDPSHRTFFVILLPALGTVWALLFAYAFARELSRNRAIDAYLRRNDAIDQSRQGTVPPQDHRPF